MSTPVIVSLIAGGVLLVVVVLFLMSRRDVDGPALARVCGGCHRGMMPAWQSCMFCGWSPASRLEFMSGPNAGQVIPLNQDVTTIGSVAGNTIVLADPAVSRKHVGIRQVNGNYEFADLGSTNGVYVNGHKMPKKTLQSGDILRVGNTEMVFRRD
jgi:hypothetical protein